MNTLRILGRVVLVKMWLLPIGVGAVDAAWALLLRALAADASVHVGDLTLLAAVLALPLTSVARAARGGS